jgi:hypothetical protein
VQPPAPQSTAPRIIESREPEPVDLLDVAGAPVLQRLIPVAIGAVILFVIWRLTRRR